MHEVVGDASAKRTKIAVYSNMLPINQSKTPGAFMTDLDIDWAWQPFEATEGKPWNAELAAHLRRRAGFGGNADSIAVSTAGGVDAAIAQVFDRTAANNDFERIADSLAQTILASGDANQLSAAWVYRLMNSPDQLLEKCTLFWHGHFATSASKVKSPDLMWRQNQVLRQNALGSFPELVNEIAKDPAMLIYLDSQVNRKAHPNENFARELMELFCLGEGAYTENDVLELARCFTGWEIRRGRFRKNRYQQDFGTKTLLGSSGNFDGEDGIEVIIEQPDLEMFLARKWFRFFVADEPEPTNELIKPLANKFREAGLQIRPALEFLFRSNLFYSKHAIGRKIKSPAEFVIGVLRCLDITSNTELIAKGLRDIGQGLFFPPNVKGWEGGRNWINSSTLLGRSNLIADILSNDATRFGGKSLQAYLAENDLQDPESLIQLLTPCLLPAPLAAATRKQLLDNFAADSRDREQKYRSLVHSFVSLPQCQLG